MKSKFIIGSANFVEEYGAGQKKINDYEIRKILKLAKENSIYKIDTAEVYFKNKNIFKKIDKKFEVISKINPDNKWISLEYCRKKLLSHFQKFNNNKINTLLFHDEKILLKKEGSIIFKNIERFKNKYFKKIGISIYETKNLKYLTNSYEINVVQVPYNILNNKIICSGWYSKLKKMGIEIHARSIFLQGLLVNKLLYKKMYFKKWYSHFYKWFESLKINNISPIDYCLNDLMNYDFDGIIIGINNRDNLYEIINFNKIKNSKLTQVKKIKINDKKLTDPRKWKSNEN